MVERKEYIQTLERWRDKKVIKVVTGISGISSYVIIL